MYWLRALSVVGVLALVQADPALARLPGFDAQDLSAASPYTRPILSDDKRPSYKIAQNGGGRITPPPKIIRPNTTTNGPKKTAQTPQSAAGKVAAKGKSALAAMRNKGKDLLAAGKSALTRGYAAARGTAAPAIQAQVKQKLALRVGRTAAAPAQKPTTTSRPVVAQPAQGVPLGTPVAMDKLKGTLRKAFNDAASPQDTSSVAEDKPPQPSPPSPTDSPSGNVGLKP